jgi:hypothetical protein
MKRTVSRYLASFALAAIPTLRPTAALAQAAGSERVVVGIVDQFRQATAGWPSLFLPYAQMLLLGLLALEAYLSWADWQTRQIGLERVVAEAVRKLGVIALVWAFFTNPLLGPEQVITVFRDVAGHAAGVSDAGALPGDLVLQGFSLADVLLRAAGQAMGELVTAWWEISRNLIEQGAVDGGFLGVGSWWRISTPCGFSPRRSCWTSSSPPWWSGSGSWCWRWGSPSSRCRWCSSSWKPSS